MIEMLIKTKQMFFFISYELKRHLPFLEMGSGSSSLLKRHALEKRVSASTQNRHFQKWHKKLSVVKLKLYRHIVGTPETYITSCKMRHNRCPLINVRWTMNVCLFNITFLLKVHKWSYYLRLPDIFSISSLQKCSSFSLRWETDFSTSSKERRELTVMMGESVDPGGTERDWKLYTDAKTQ